MSQQNAALAARGREVLEFQRSGLSGRVLHACDDVRELQALKEGLERELDEFARIVAKGRRNEFFALADEFQQICGVVPGFSASFGESGRFCESDAHCESGSAGIRKTSEFASK